MGDRTTVRLFVPNEYAAVVESMDDSFEDKCPGNKETVFTYHEVNYGELDFLPELEEQGIAYDSGWDAGDQYGPGTRSCRFTPEGEIDIREIYDCDHNPDLSQLLALIDQPEKLREAILIHKESITPLPWDNQVEYGKLYLARKLIEPNP